MGRKPKVQYLVTAHYSIGWGGNRDLLTSGFGPPDEAEAMQHASTLVDEMRLGGSGDRHHQVPERRPDEGCKTGYCRVRNEERRCPEEQRRLPRPTST